MAPGRCSLQARGASRQGARVQRVRSRRRHSGRCQATPRLGQVEADHAAVSVVNGSLLCLAIARAFVAGVAYHETTKTMARFQEPFAATLVSSSE